MGEVFAGFICGYILALVFAPVAALTLLRQRAPGGLLARLVPANTSLTGLAVILHGALFLFWTAVGMVLGLVLMAMEDAGGAIGSKNIAFSLLVFALTLGLLAPVAIIFVRLRMITLAAGLVIVGLFGWLMPYLAEWSSFGSS